MYGRHHCSINTIMEQNLYNTGIQLCRGINYHLVTIPYCFGVVVIEKLDRYNADERFFKICYQVRTIVKKKAIIMSLFTKVAHQLYFFSMWLHRSVA